MYIHSDIDFEWDPGKAELNLKKHGVDFADAVTVFFDLNAVTIPDPGHDEDRFVTLGMSDQGTLLVVTYTHRADKIRIISARKASRSEYKHYAR